MKLRRPLALVSQRNQLHAIFSTTISYSPLMPDAEKLTPADPSDVADALAYALHFFEGVLWIRV